MIIHYHHALLVKSLSCPIKYHHFFWVYPTLGSILGLVPTLIPPRNNFLSRTLRISHPIWGYPFSDKSIHKWEWRTSVTTSHSSVNAGHIRALGFRPTRFVLFVVPSFCKDASNNILGVFFRSWSQLMSTAYGVVWKCGTFTSKGPQGPHASFFCVFSPGFFLQFGVFPSATKPFLEDFWCHVRGLAIHCSQSKGSGSVISFTTGDPSEKFSGLGNAMENGGFSVGKSWKITINGGFSIINIYKYL